MLFLSVRGFLDYAEPTGHSRFYAASHVAFSGGDRIGDSEEILFEAQSPGPPQTLTPETLVYVSSHLDRAACRQQNQVTCQCAVEVCHEIDASAQLLKPILPED